MGNINMYPLTQQATYTWEISTCIPKPSAHSKNNEFQNVAHICMDFWATHRQGIPRYIQPSICFQCQSKVIALVVLWSFTHFCVYLFINCSTCSLLNIHEKLSRLMWSNQQSINQSINQSIYMYMWWYDMIYIILCRV